MLKIRISFFAMAIVSLATGLAAGRAAEQWTQVDAPHFTVLTTASPKVARQWAVELEKFRRTLQTVVRVPEERVRPATVVLFRDERAMRPFKPLENGRPKRVAGFFADVADSHTFALTLDEQPRTIRRVLFHEAVHWHSAAGDQPLPTWLEEGVAEVYSTFELREDGRVSFGRAIQEHVQLIGGRQIELPKLMQKSRAALKYNDGGDALAFYAASWGIAHYLLFGKDTPGRASIERYLAAARTQEAGEAFRTAFGVDEEEFSRRLAAYMRQGQYTVYTYAVDLGDFEQKLAVGPAKPGEVDRALGLLLVGARGTPTPEALTRLRSAVQLAPQSARAWQALGEATYLTKDFAEAGRHFERAVEAGSDSYFAHFGLGYSRMLGQDALAGFGSPAEAERAAADFRRAIELSPRFVPAYENLAGLISLLERYVPGDREMLLRAERLAPASALVRIGLAVCDLREGRDELGLAALQAVLDDRAVQGRDRGFAEELLVNHRWKALTAKIDSAFDRRDHAQALALIDEGRREFTGARHRQVLEFNRPVAVAGIKIAQAVEHLNAREFEPARALLHEVLESKAGTFEKGEARRLLRLLPAN